MAVEQVMWTALPNGPSEDGQRLRLTAYLTPRLTVGPGDSGELRDFPAFLNWPTTLSDVAFRVEVQGGPTLDADPDPESREPEPPTWDLLFPRDMPVATREFDDLSDRKLRSFPFDEVLESVGDLYGDVAAQSPSAFPSLDSIVDRLGRLGARAGAKGRFYDLIDDGLIRTGEKKGGGVYRPTGLSGTQAEIAAFAQAYRFYDRPGTRIGPNDAVPAPPPPPKVDFHAACNFMADYPELLRRLGLAIDLVIDGSIPKDGQLRIVVQVPGALGWMKPAAMRPWTRYLKPPGRFFAEPRKDGDLDEGMLNLGDERFVLSDLDVDGSGMKFVDFAATAVRLLGRRATADPEGVSLPALHNAGITVARRNRALGVAQQIAAASGRHDKTDNGTPAVLFADDITRGYRIDVFDEDSGAWRSLCRRDGTYVVDRGQPTTLEVDPDEGYVKGASTTSVPDWLPGSDSDLYLHEAVFGWDGWSLVAPRPGQAPPTHPGEDTTPVEDNPCGLTVTFEPQRQSLPPLRFGRRYRVRARAVDLAGNGFTWDDGGVPGQTDSPPHRYRRWEPVPAPAVVPRRPFKEGESLMRMVIRSTLGRTATGYSALERVRDLPGHEKVSGKDKLDRSYRPADERHIAPPKGAVQLAETHGLLDDAFGGKSQAVRDDFFDIAAREKGTFLDVEVTLPASPTTKKQLGYVKVVNQNDPPTTLPLAERGAPLAKGEYVVHDTEELILPYLPDPLARGASMLGLPGQSDVHARAFDGSWPDAKPFRIKLVEGNAPPDWDGAKRVLTVSLPPAEVARVRLSCYLEAQGAGKSDLDLLAVWALLPSVLQSSLRADALNGLHWMLTPPDELVLVHAVEKPLEPPVFSLGDGDLHRLPGDTFVSLAGELAANAKSTGRLDIEATWTEPIDDLARTGPEDVDGATHVADFQIEPSEDTVQLGRDDSATGMTPIVHKARHEFGDTKHRHVEYMSVATTRFREYFPPEITGDPELITHKGPPNGKVHVPSSRRPDPPEVLYVVPTFRWEEGDETVPSGTTSWRRRQGGGLRVYLDRPWYSSGADEHLAVVLPNQKPPILIGELAGELAAVLAEAGLDRSLFESAARRLGVKGATARTVAAALTEALADRMEATGEMPPALVPRSLAVELVEAVALDFDILSVLAPPDVSKYVTRWGQDPIWSSAALASGPRIQSFPNAARWDTDLGLPEAPGALVSVAAFEPRFDAERGLWYCDIDVDAGPAYFPFIRLALARYQPYSIPGVELSRVVLAEFAQLTPDRTARVRPLREGALASVSVTGVAGVNDVSDRVPVPDDPERLIHSRLLIAQFERLPRSTAGDVGWEPVGERRVLSLAGGTRPQVRWAGTVRVPPPERGFDYRLAVEEYELYETDESQAEYHETTASEPVTIGFGRDFEARGIRLPVETPLRGRMIYADHFAYANRRGALELVVPKGGR